MEIPVAGQKSYSGKGHARARQKNRSPLSALDERGNVLVASLCFICGRTFSRVARAAASQFPSVLHRPEHLSDRLLDDECCHRMACLPAHRLGPSAGHGRLLRSDSGLFPRALCRCLDRTAGSSHCSALHASHLHGAIPAVGSTHPQRPHHHAPGHPSQRCWRHRQCCRYARATVLHDQDGE